MTKKSAPRKPNPVRRFFSLLGPGLITGAADDDPSGIATYSIAGAQLGTTFLWTAFITWLMACVQFMCARIGMVTGWDWATRCEKRGRAGYCSWERWRFSPFFSNFVMYFIILTTALVLHAHGIKDIETSKQAAEALRPLAGTLAYLLYTIGIIGVGFTPSQHLLARPRTRLPKLSRGMKAWMSHFVAHARSMPS